MLNVLLQTSHPSVEHIPVFTGHSDRCDWRHQLPLHEAVCALQVTAVPPSQVRVEEQRLPGQIQNSGNKAYFNSTTRCKFDVTQLRLGQIGDGKGMPAE